MKRDKLARELKDLDPPWVRVEAFTKLKLRRPVVLVNGCFDIFHSGHAKILHHAAKHGRTIIVAMDSDRLVAEHKPGRPIQNWVERATMFRYFPVDYLVEVDSDNDFSRLVTLAHPDLRVKGAEYRGRPSRCQEIPTLFVHQAGQRTTDIIERIKRR